DDPQAPEAHMGRVLIMREGESVAAVQPSSPALAARHAISKGNHRFLLWHRGKDVTTGVCHLQSLSRRRALPFSSFSVSSGPSGNVFSHSVPGEFSANG